MGFALIQDTAIIFLVAMAITYLFHRIRLPPIMGFLVTGTVVGPYGLSLVRNVHEVEVLAELGVIALLFTLGIEFSLERLVALGRAVLVGGPLQVGLTGAAVAALGLALGLPPGQAILFGGLVALSSTAIVTRLLQSRAELDTAHGQMAVGILIFQDLVAVIFLLAVPLLANGPSMGLGEMVGLALRSAGALGIVFLAARWIVPELLHQVARTRMPELFLLALVGLCLGIAWVASLAGLSLAFGAFLAGLIVSESPYSHHTLDHITPFRDMFMTFFFVSVGMLLDIGFVVDHLGILALLTGGVILLKGVLASVAAVIWGASLRTAFRAGLALAQVGEFSFVLAGVGLEHGLLPGDLYQYFLAFAVLTMAATPSLMAAAPGLVQGLLRLPWPSGLRRGRRPLRVREPQVRLRDHLVVVGYGVVGRNVALAARLAQVPYAVLELNPDTVQREQSRGEPIFYGDATRRSALLHVGVDHAHMVVVAIDDPVATRRVTGLVRELNPTGLLLVRTRHVAEVPALQELGADEVIPEEYETALAIFQQVLRRFGFEPAEVERMVHELRSRDYQRFRSAEPDRPPRLSPGPRPSPSAETLPETIVRDRDLRL